MLMISVLLLVYCWELCFVECSASVMLYIRDVVFFFFQAEDGMRDLVLSRGLGDLYMFFFKQKTAYEI